ncbi:MAG: sulfatase-like hydrolase/transferase, partial [Roseibacillus sp.]
MRIVVLLLLFQLTSLFPAAARPNILFLLVDDLRHDTFGFAGHKICRTPHLDRLAAESHVFKNAFVTTAICMVSRASI